MPHLLTEVVTNPKRAANALDWAVREMEMRYDVLADIGVRDITGYNAMFDRGELPTADDPDPETGKSYERLPFIVVVVDELADLMMVAARDVETSICRLAQMARAVGIHLVIATQRPSVDVITGVIKANIPSRLAFSVSTLADSRVILDQMGAEKLIGKGDMLMLTASSSRTERVQGAWVDEECVRKVVAHWRRQVTRDRRTSRACRAPTGRRRPRRRRRRRHRRPARRGDGARRARGHRLDEHAAAQAPRRLRPGRPAHGPARSGARAWSGRDRAIELQPPYPEIVVSSRAATRSQWAMKALIRPMISGSTSKRGMALVRHLDRVEIGLARPHGRDGGGRQQVGIGAANDHHRHARQRLELGPQRLQRPCRDRCPPASWRVSTS